VRARPNVPEAVVRHLRELAAGFIPGSSILLDSSSEAILLAGFMSHIPNLVVTTAGLPVALELSARTSHSVILLGGQLHAKSQSVLVTSSTLDPAGPFDVGIFGGAAYTAAAGLMEREPAMARSKRLQVNRCRRVCAVVSSPQVDVFGPYSFLPPASITELVILDDWHTDVTPGVTKAQQSRAD
jgi:DeoR/GlpR family transcriptional regulator of sugar metabolism